MKAGEDLTKQAFRQSRGSVDSHVADLSGVCEHDFGGLLCRKCGFTQREIVFGPLDPTLSIEQIKEVTDRILKDARKGMHMNATRCKVRLVSISGGYYGTDKGRTVEFRAVSDGSEENKRFFAATPSAEFKVNLSAEAAQSLGLDQGKIGSEFYVDFTPAA